MRKSHIVVIIFSLSVAILALSLGGCSDKITGNTDSPQSDVESSSDVFTSTEEAPLPAPAESVPTEPEGEPTFLIGLDGKPIYTSEISRLRDTEKTAETLTEDDLYANIYCDGFTYCKLPSDILYDSYHNPEMFDGYRFTDEASENENEWKRVYVGDIARRVRRKITGIMDSSQSTAESDSIIYNSK